MAVVTISRLLGAGGDEIAMRLSERLGYDLVDNALIINVAERAGVSFEQIRQFDEKYRSRALEWLMAFIEPRMGKILADGEHHIEPRQFMEYSRTVILGLAGQGNVVIVGRGGQFILEDNDIAFHIRIVASETSRAKRIAARYHISRQEAIDRIHKSDDMRKHYIERYFARNWNDPLAYHITIDPSRLSINETVDILVNAVQLFGYTHEYIPGKRDRRHGERRHADRRNSERRNTGVGWTPRDPQEAVILEGSSSQVLSNPDRRNIERRENDRRNRPSAGKS